MNEEYEDDLAITVDLGCEIGHNRNSMVQNELTYMNGGLIKETKREGLGPGVVNNKSPFILGIPPSNPSTCWLRNPAPPQNKFKSARKQTN